MSGQLWRRGEGLNISGTMLTTHGPLNIEFKRRELLLLLMV